MRDCSPALLSYLLENNVAWRADLLTVVLGSGATYRWTTWNTDLTVVNYNRWDAQSFLAPPNAPVVSVGREDEGEGLSVSTLEVTLSGTDFRVEGKVLTLAAADGLFDGALITIDHLIMPAPGNVSLQSFIDWDGRVSQPDIGVTAVTLRCRSWLDSAVTTQLPRRTFSAGCQWEHYGPQCGLNRDSYKYSGTVTTAVADPIPTTTTEFSATTPIPQWYEADRSRGYFDLGVIEFTGNVTSALAGVRRDVLKGNVDWRISLAQPLPVAPAEGDTFDIWQGCALDASSCQRFNNMVHFGGFPFVPPNASTPVK